MQQFYLKKTLTTIQLTTALQLKKILLSIYLYVKDKANLKGIIFFRIPNHNTIHVNRNERIHMDIADMFPIDLGY